MAKKTGRKGSRREQARQRETHWRKVLAEWSKTGLTQTAFCRERGLSLSAFGWWKGELARRDAERGPKQRAKSHARGSRGKTTGFLPVRVMGSREPGGAGERVGIGDGCIGLEVVLVNGRRVRVGSDVDDELLAKVVRVLEGVAW
jgi:hypothetical protein